MFTIGISNLEELLGTISAPYAILIAGHPGSGKTTLASTICYANTLKGHKCLYLSLYEDKEKFYRFMDRLGLRFTDAEFRGLFKYFNLPLTLNVSDVVNAINEVISEGYDIVVIDSITALLESVEESATKRAWLLNYFYQLPKLLNGLLILISELPYGEEKLGLGSIEFITDSILILKHRVEERFLVRLLEIRKTRGAPIYVAEIPFAIVQGRGVEVFTPPILEKIPEQGEELYPPCNAHRETIGHFHRGFLVNVFYQPETIYGKDALSYLLAFAIKNSMKILLISYISPPSTLLELISRTLERYGIDSEKVLKIIEKYITIRAVNPYAYSTSQLVAQELSLINEIKPDIVVFHGVHVIRLITSNYGSIFRELYNEVMYLKSRGINIVRIGNHTDDYTTNIEASISDTTFKSVHEYYEDKVETKIYVFRRYREPIVFSFSDFMKCLEECVNIIRSEAFSLSNR
ncbi:MAG: ATPase domain-containing protein [Ignisphaera sp.]